MTGLNVEGMWDVLKEYLPGFAIEQLTSPGGKVTVHLSHTFEIAYKPTANVRAFVDEVVGKIDKAILSTKPVYNLTEDLVRANAQIEALMKQLSELQRYADYVAVTKEIAKAGAK